MIEDIATLSNFDSEFFNAYDWLLRESGLMLREYPFRYYAAHFSDDSSGSVYRIWQRDESGWKFALEALQLQEEKGRAVLTGFVEVHF